MIEPPTVEKDGDPPETPTVPARIETPSVRSELGVPPFRESAWERAPAVAIEPGAKIRLPFFISIEFPSIETKEFKASEAPVTVVWSFTSGRMRMTLPSARFTAPVFGVVVS